MKTWWVWERWVSSRRQHLAIQRRQKEDAINELKTEAMANMINESLKATADEIITIRNGVMTRRAGPMKGK